MRFFIKKKGEEIFSISFLEIIFLVAFIAFLIRIFRLIVGF